MNRSLGLTALESVWRSFSFNHFKLVVKYYYC